MKAYLSVLIFVFTLNGSVYSAKKLKDDSASINDLFRFQLDKNFFQEASFSLSDECLEKLNQLNNETSPDGNYTLL